MTKSEPAASASSPAAFPPGKVPARMTAPKKRKRSASSDSTENPSKRPKVKATAGAKQPAPEPPKEDTEPMVVESATDDVSDAESESGESTATAATASSAKSVDEAVRKGFGRSGDAFGKALAAVCTRRVLAPMRADTRSQIKTLRTKISDSLKNMDKVNKKRMSELEAKISAAVSSSSSSSTGGTKELKYCSTHFGSKASSALAVRKAIHATLRKDIVEYNDYLKSVEAGEDAARSRPPNNRENPSMLGMVRDAMLYLVKNDPKVADAFSIDSEADVDGELDEDEIRERDAALELAQQENADYTPGDEATMYDGENDDKGNDDDEDDGGDDSEDLDIDPDEARKELADLMDDSIDEEAERAARAKDDARAKMAAGKREEDHEAANDGDDNGTESDAEYEYKPARGTEVACPVWELKDKRWRDCAYQIVNEYGELVLDPDGNVTVIPSKERETCDKDDDDDVDDE